MGNQNEHRLINIFEEYEKELSEGLQGNKLTIDDIEKMLGQRLTMIKEALLSKTEEIIGRESGDAAECCKTCGRTLKKTKKETSR
jgi:hypothetical protein